MRWLASSRPADAHFCNLQDSLLAGHVLQLQSLDLRLRCLAALADRCAEVPLCDHVQAGSSLAGPAAEVKQSSQQVRAAHSTHEARAGRLHHVQLRTIVLVDHR